MIPLSGSIPVVVGAVGPDDERGERLGTGPAPPRPRPVEGSAQSIAPVPLGKAFELIGDLS